MSKILIVGIGGVGAYFGGLLSKLNQINNDISVCFMARGENLQAIKNNGLFVSSSSMEFNTRPAIVSDNPEDFGKVDYIILSTKSYDIEETVRNLNICVTEETVFLPLLNGVDSAEKIKEIYPNNLVADGCAYIISRLVKPGYVENMGNIQKLIFGVPDTEDKRLSYLFEVFQSAGIEATLTKDITAKIWEKFIFISSTATITSYYNKTFGEIREDKVYSEDLKQLIEECFELAKHKKINLDSGIIERVWTQFLNVPAEATTSMHSDFLSSKNKTEVESLTGYIVKEANKYGLELPKYTEMYTGLLDR